MSFSAPGSPSLDLARFTPVNDLWAQLVERLGLERSGRAVRQALDLQAMRGDRSTLPVLLLETCGLALIQAEALRAQLGLAGVAEDHVLLVSQRSFRLQLLQSQASTCSGINSGDLVQAGGGCTG